MYNPNDPYGQQFDSYGQQFYQEQQQLPPDIFYDPVTNQWMQMQQPGYGYYEPPKKSVSGWAVASLVCGIVGLCLCFYGIVLSILAIIFAVVSKKTGGSGGIMISGLVTGIIGTTISAVVWALAMIGAMVPLLI